MRSIALGLCLVASLSLAQKTEVPAPKPQNVEFQPGEVTGEPAFPLGKIYLVPPQSKFKSLIKLRANFNDKLQESVHEM